VLWAFDMEFCIFLVCMQKGATNEGQTELILIVLCSAGCGGSRGKDSSSEDALLWSVHFTLLSSPAPLISETFVVWGDTGLRYRSHVR